MERAPQTLVVDASVVAKWFIPEEGSEKALRIKARHVEGGVELFAPDLLIYEVVNALRFNPGIDDAALTKGVKALFAVDIEFIPPSSEATSSAATRARELGVTLYDAYYISISEYLATKLVTSDGELFRRLRDTRKVLLLGEMDLEWTLP